MSDMFTFNDANYNCSESLFSNVNLYKALSNNPSGLTINQGSKSVILSGIDTNSLGVEYYNIICKTSRCGSNHWYSPY